MECDSDGAAALHPEAGILGLESRSKRPFRSERRADGEIDFERDGGRGLRDCQKMRLGFLH
jgi:hypothetical protein